MKAEGEQESLCDGQGGRWEGDANHRPDRRLADRTRNEAKQRLHDFRRAVTKLTKWLAAEGHAPTIEGVTKRIASDYRMATFVRPGVNPKTAKGHLGLPRYGSSP